MSRKFLVLAASLCLVLVFAPALFAQDNPVVLTVRQPVAIPNTVLEPGTYVMRFVNERENEVVIRAADGAPIGIFSVVDAYRANPTGDFQIDVQHADGGARIVSWFVPGSTLGWAFAYPHGKGAVVATTGHAAAEGK